MERSPNPYDKLFGNILSNLTLLHQHILFNFDLNIEKILLTYRQNVTRSENTSSKSYLK